jgi:hypothetical protein
MDGTEMKDVFIEDNPQPDARSPDEQAACNAAWRVFGRPVKSIFIIDNSAGAGVHRKLYVYFWIHWINKRHFKTKQKAMVEAVRAVIGPVGEVHVELVPAEVLRQAQKEQR